MSERIINLDDYRKKKLETNPNIVHKENSSIYTVSPMYEQFKEYLEVMKKIIKGQEYRMGTLIIDCLGSADVTFTGGNGEDLSYHKEDMGFSFLEESESEDLIIGSLVYFSPSQIIIKNSAKLNRHLLFVITTIFEGRVKLEPEEG